MLAVFQLGKTLLVMDASASAASLHTQPCEEDDRPYCSDGPSHPASWKRLHSTKTLFNHSVNLNPLPDPTKDEAVLEEVVSGDHQDGAAIEGRAKDCQPFLEVEVKEGKG